MIITLYTINEETARRAKNAISFSDYEAGSATAEYISYIKEFEGAVNDLINAHPIADDQLELVQYYANKYSEKLAQFINDDNANTARYPSVMICGAGNFNTRKKQKQNARADALWEKNGDLFKTTDNYYYNKINNIICNNMVLRGDINALAKLENKREMLEDQHARLKAVNAYFRKNKTVDGCPAMNDDIKKIVDHYQSSMLASLYTMPIPSYELAYLKRDIKTVTDRIADITQLKQTANTTDYPTVDGVTVEENTELMRIQLFFDGVPDQETRNALKHRAFRWSPSQGAWQRVLTKIAQYDTINLLKQLKADQE